MSPEKKQKINLKNIALLGLGKDNLALLYLFEKHKAPVTITICDFRQKDKLPKLKLKNIKLFYQLGASFNTNLEKFDILYRSPGWPLNCPGIRAAYKLNKKIEVTSALNFFFDLCPSKNIIGVSGTKGKGTTATLIYKILKSAYKNKREVFLGGNIGIAPLSFLEKIKTNDYVVLELSSFQLEDLKHSPKIALLTNLFPEHLAPADPNNPNYHSSLNSYFKAKLNIAKGPSNKFLIANLSLKDSLEKLKLEKDIIYFSKSELKTKLVGDYNKENIAASVALAKLLKIKPSVYEPVIAKFGNLEHRLRLVAKKADVKYYNNSFSTTPESSILDLKSFSGGIIQIAGGADKGASFKNLAKTILEKTSHLILLPGKGSEKIAKELEKIKFPKVRLHFATSMESAVNKAFKLSKPHDIVLLSTACASFGIFKNYKERGELFEKYVNKIKAS